MRKPQLLILLAEARRLVGPAAPPPVVVGSRSFHALRGAPLPESVPRSAECDHYLTPGFPGRRRLEEDLGADSAFYTRHGFYVLTIGAGTVIPSPGWPGRLEPVRDERGTIRAGAVRAGTLLERALLFGPSRLGGVLADRLREEAAEVARALASLARPAPGPGDPGQHPSPPDAGAPTAGRSRDPGRGRGPSR